MLKKFLNYKDAKDYINKNFPDIINNRIRNRTQRNYQNWVITNKLYFLPTNPWLVYKEWTSMYDYLSVKKFEENILSYNDAVKFNIKNKFKNNREWRKWITINKPVFLPSNPHKFYKEWKSWSDFLGIDRKSNKQKFEEMLSFNEAKIAIQKLKFGGIEEYRFWHKNINNFKIKVPFSPDKKYKEWISWQDYLGSYTSKISIGENKIQQILNSHNIKYIKNYKFAECKNVRKLPFDFYLPEYNICIEYDGIQHFEPVDYFGGKIYFEERKKIDEIKTKFCIDNDIILIRIPYWEISKVEKILLEKIFKKNENLIKNFIEFFNF